MFSAQGVAGVGSVEDDCAKNTTKIRTLDEDMPISMQHSHAKRAKNCNHAPIPASFQDIDTAVFAELPEDIRLELSRAYKTKSSATSRGTNTYPHRRGRRISKMVTTKPPVESKKITVRHVSTANILTFHFVRRCCLAPRRLGYGVRGEARTLE